MPLKPKETTLTKNFIKWLNSLPKTKALKRHAGPGRKGRLDVTGACNGIRFEIEIKVGDNKPTPKQNWWINYWARAGAVAFWGNTLWQLKKEFKTKMQEKGIFIL